MHAPACLLETGKCRDPFEKAAAGQPVRDLGTEGVAAAILDEVMISVDQARRAFDAGMSCDFVAVAGDVDFERGGATAPPWGFEKADELVEATGVIASDDETTG